MNEIQNWDDYRLFIAVAQAQGLVGATQLSGTSAATLSRRMHLLEKSLSIPLFIRHREGYQLTAQGEILLEKVQQMQQVTQDVAHWRDTLNVRSSVKVAAGDWTSMFIARSLAGLLKEINPVRIELLSGSARLDLGRREACLGIRNSRPKTQGLAGQRVARVEFAIYVANSVYRGKLTLDDLNAHAYDWLSLHSKVHAVPSAMWLAQQLKTPASVSCSSSLSLLEGAKRGVGCAVLPCFIGDSEESLCRVSSTIPALSHDQWLVCHAEDRDNVAINKVKDALARLIRDHETLFLGINVC